MKNWSETERLVIGDIINHLKLYEYNGWIPVLLDVCAEAGMEPRIALDVKKEISLTELRSQAFSMASSGHYGEYPTDESFNTVVEEGFSDDGTSWTALDGTIITADEEKKEPKLKDVLERYGEPWCYNHQYDFGLEGADKVADFYNNGGLEIRDERGVNNAIQYIALIDGTIEIGAWAWSDDEDFDEDATFELYYEDDFSACELDKMIKQIEEIYK